MPRSSAPAAQAHLRNSKPNSPTVANAKNISGFSVRTRGSSCKPATSMNSARGRDGHTPRNSCFPYLAGRRSTDGETPRPASTLCTSCLTYRHRDLFTSRKEAGERIDNCYIELKDLARELGSQVDEVEFDPACLETISRLDTPLLARAKISRKPDELSPCARQTAVSLNASIMATRSPRMPSAGRFDS